MPGGTSAEIRTNTTRGKSRDRTSARPSTGKQITWLANTESAGAAKYSTAAGSPLYVPKDRRPHLGELVGTARVVALQREIDASGLGEDERRFLTQAAQRHAVFNYELIADYYAHATPEMQRLMEASALVIVDINQAIERGYVQLCDSVRKAYMEELANGS